MILVDGRMPDVMGKKKDVKCIFSTPDMFCRPSFITRSGRTEPGLIVACLPTYLAPLNLFPFPYYNVSKSQ